MPCAFNVESVRRSGWEPMWYAPVPQESMVFMRGCEGAREVKTPSDIVERPGGVSGGGGSGGAVGVQMLPRQTKRTETGLGELVSAIVDSV